VTPRLLRRAAVAPGEERDLAVSAGMLVAPEELPRGTEVLDLQGRAVIAGLVDHHVHLLATAAALVSVDLTPAALHAAGSLTTALRRARRARPSGWLRGIGYDEVASGPLDRELLDRAGVGPVRIQDRSGVTWMLDAVGLERVRPADPGDWPPGTEVVDGRPTGRFFRCDGWLRSRIPHEPPDLVEVGRRLATRGVTAVVDASVTNGPDELELLAGAGMPQRLVAMTGGPEIAAPGGIRLGPTKIVLDDVDLPALDDLSAAVRRAHDSGRCVAVHCVTRTQLVLALAAGIGPGDRIEHGSVIPDGAIELLARSGVTVVTQPGLIRTRGDRYLREVDRGDLDSLYRLRSLLDAGVPVAIGSDAPYGPIDPWVHVAAAVDRRSADGAVIGGDEAMELRKVLGLLQRDPGAAHRPGPGLAVGAPADLCVLDTDWVGLARDPAVAEVHSTWIDGTPVHMR